MDSRALCGAWNVVERIGGGQHLVDDVDDTVAGRHVGHGHGRVVDQHATVDGEREGLAVGGIRGHALGDVGGWDVGPDHVVEQDVRQCCLAFGCVKGAEINARIDEGLIGGREDGEGSRTLQGFQQLSLDHARHEGVVQPRALRGSRDVVGRVGRREHLVDDVDESVGRNDVRHDHVRVVDHDPAVDGEGERLSVGGVRGHAFGDVGGRDVSADHVVQQNVREGGLAGLVVERAQVDASVGERLIGRCKDGEGARSLEGGQKFSLNDGRDETPVDAGGLSRGRDVHGWEHDTVDHVDDAVGGLDVRSGDVRVADGDAVCVNTELHTVTVDGGGKHAVRQRTGGH